MRLIDADKVPPLSDLRGCGYEGNEYLAYKSGAEYWRGLVDDTPTIDPESLRPTAHWIKRGYVCGENEYECSACHEIEWRTSARRMKYCMFCGSRMSKEIEYR